MAPRILATRRQGGVPRTLVAVAVCLSILLAGACSRQRPSPDVFVGMPTTTSTAPEGPLIVRPPDPEPIEQDTGPEEEWAMGEGGGDAPLAVPDGAPYGPALPFDAGVEVPGDLVFVLVVGSDARPGEEVLAARADSIHLLAVNPRTGTGTLLGIPRDSWVAVPGHGTAKVNAALSLGGPALLAETVRLLTGLPVHYWVVTGFQGLESMVDALGGVNVLVEQRTDDGESGARFEPGWHRFDGGEALAFSRNRKDVPQGDFSRSENQGRVLLAALTKLRAETRDRDGLRAWLGVLLRHVHLEVPASRLDDLAVVARVLGPARVANVVAPGAVGTAGGQSVVLLDDAARDLFVDLRDDATVGRAEPPPPTSAAPSQESAPEEEPAGPPPSTDAPPTSSGPDEPGATSTTSPSSTTSTTSSTGPPLPTLP